MSNAGGNLLRAGHAGFLTAGEGPVEIEDFSPVGSQFRANLLGLLSRKLGQSNVGLFRRRHQGTDDMVSLAEGNAALDQMVERIWDG